MHVASRMPPRHAGRHVVTLRFCTTTWGDLNDHRSPPCQRHRRERAWLPRSAGRPRGGPRRPGIPDAAAESGRAGSEPGGGALAENVYAGPGQDGGWWFWWSWAERIAAADDLAGAALLISRVLAARE